MMQNIALRRDLQLAISYAVAERHRCVVIVLQISYVAKAKQEVAISSKEGVQKTSEIGAGQALLDTQAEELAGTEEKLANDKQSFAIAIPPASSSLKTTSPFQGAQRIAWVDDSAIQR